MSNDDIFDKIYISLKNFGLPSLPASITCQ
jgi:hypothetical protein